MVDLDDKMEEVYREMTDLKLNSKNEIKDVNEQYKILQNK